MAIIYEIKERRVIPNWRDYKRTLQIGELGNSSDQPLEINIDRVVNDWSTSKNIGTAAELINAAFISGKNEFSDLLEAIKLIRENPSSASNTLLSLVDTFETGVDNNSLTKSNKFILEKDVDTINEFQALINNKSLFRVINKTKKRSVN